MPKISLKKDYTDGSVLYGKDLNPNFELIETVINENVSVTPSDVDEIKKQVESINSSLETDYDTSSEVDSKISSSSEEILSSSKGYTDEKLMDYAKTEVIPTKLSQLSNDNNTVTDSNYVHTDNNYSNEDKNKLNSLENYELPIATTDTLGGIKLGEGLEAGENGKVNVVGGGGSGTPGEDGATFTPSVSPEGELSWTNNKDLPNPDPVNIKGEPGTNGKDYLFITVVDNTFDYPEIGRETGVSKAYFSREPEIGDNVILVGEASNEKRSYIALCKVTSMPSKLTVKLMINQIVETTGEAGQPGLQGEKGETGVGVPIGGTTGQILSKFSNDDYDTTWIDAPSGGGSTSGVNYISDGTKESPTDLSLLKDTGIYIINGWWKTNTTGGSTNANPVILFCQKNANDVVQQWLVSPKDNNNGAMEMRTVVTGLIDYDFFVKYENVISYTGSGTIEKAVSTQLLAKMLGNDMPLLTSLTTNDKSSLVTAINELKAEIDALKGSSS